MRTFDETYEFDYQQETYPLDLNNFPASEAIWLERETKLPLSYLMENFTVGGITGALALLLLALRRGGKHGLAKWSRVQTIGVTTLGEFQVRRLPIVDEPDTDDQQGEAADPTSPSPSTLTGSGSAAPTGKRSAGSRKK